MALEMIDLDKRFVQGHRQTLGERSTDKKRSQKSRAACECNGGDVFRSYSGAVYRLAYDRHNIYLMSSRGKLGNDSAISFMNILACKHIGQKEAVFYDCRRRIVAR